MPFSRLFKNKFSIVIMVLINVLSLVSMCWLLFYGPAISISPVVQAVKEENLTEKKIIKSHFIRFSKVKDKYSAILRDANSNPGPKQIQHQQQPQQQQYQQPPHQQKYQQPPQQQYQQPQQQQQQQLQQQSLQQLKYQQPPQQQYQQPQQQQQSQSHLMLQLHTQHQLRKRQHVLGVAKTLTTISQNLRGSNNSFGQKIESNTTEQPLHQFPRSQQQNQDNRNVTRLQTTTITTPTRQSSRDVVLESQHLSNIFSVGIQEYYSNAQSTRWKFPAYYINLDRAILRREWTEKLLHKLDFRYKRVRAFAAEEAVRFRLNMNIVENLLVLPVSGGEKACLLSHLFAIWQAVNDDLDENGNVRTNSSQYALILEDDVNFEMNVDFTTLIADAPSDFAILQLTTSNLEKVKSLWSDYNAEIGNDRCIWQKYDYKFGFWSTQAYLINKAVVRPLINQIIKQSTPSGRYAVTFIKPSLSECHLPGIVKCSLPFRLVADLYLYSTFSPTFVTRIPFVNSGVIGRFSQLRTGNETLNMEAISAVIRSVIDVNASNPVLPKAFLKWE